MFDKQSGLGNIALSLIFGGRRIIGQKTRQEVRVGIVTTKKNIR